MAYVAVKGGEFAIGQSQRLLGEARRGDPAERELSVKQIQEQLSLAVSRVMAEGSLYDPELAALALKQSRGDALEAVHLVRAFRNTLPRFGYSEPADTARLIAQRRISAIFKDVPGGQLLGASVDYTHRLLDFGLLGSEPHQAPAAEGIQGLRGDAAELEGTSSAMEPSASFAPVETGASAGVRALDLLRDEDIIEPELPDDPRRTVGDITRDPLTFPAHRDVRLQNLARGDEGFLMGLAYSTQRGYGRNHPFAGEIQIGTMSVEFIPEELGFAVDLGDITITECQMVNQYKGNGDVPPMFTRGYGLAFGENERRTMAMAIADRALRARELDEPAQAPAQDEEFVLSHSDSVEASGFVQHLKLPHYVDFQSELNTVRRLREAHPRAPEDKTARGRDT